MIRAAFLLLALAGPAGAETLIAIDGDTVQRRDAAGRVLERWRLAGIDAPETWRARCPAEHDRAFAAKARLRALLAEGIPTVTRHGRDRFGRALVTLIIAGRDTAATLLAEGHALPWRPGPKAKAERQAIWCPEGRKP